MLERLRRNVFRVVLILAVIVIIIVAIVRKTEMNRLRHRMEDGSPRQRIAAVERLLEKDKLRDAMEDQPRWEQDHCLTALAFLGDYRALDQILKVKKWLDAPVDARGTSTIEEWDETACGPLTRAMQDKDADTRAAAIAPAAGIPTQDAMITLCMDLMDAWDQYVRDAVRDVMSNAAMADKTAPLLADVLLEKKPTEKEELTTAEYLRRRGTAVATLEKMKDPAIEPLANLLDNPEADEKTRAQVCISLGSIGASPGDAIVLTRASLVAPHLIHALSDSSWTVERQAALALGRIQPQAGFLDTKLTDEEREQVATIHTAIRPLIEHLHHPQADVRAAAAVALGQMRAEEAAAALGELLADDRRRKGTGPEVSVAMASIGEVCVPHLRAALNNPDPSVRELAASALSAIGGGQSVPLLARHIDYAVDTAVSVRQIAAGALRNLAEIVRAARDDAESLRDAEIALPALRVPMDDLATAEELATEAIAKRKPGNERREILAKAATKVAGRLEDVRGLAEAANSAYKAGLSSVGPFRAAQRAVPALTQARDILLTAENGFPEDCEDILTAMTVQTKLAAQLRTARRSFAAAIQEINDDAELAEAVGAAMPALANALGDPDWHVYIAARDALTHMGARAVPVLVSAMRSGDARISYTASQGVAAIGYPAVAALVGHLGDPDTNVATWAAIALGDIGDPAVDSLMKVVKGTRGEGPVARANAARALGLCRDIQGIEGGPEDVVNTLAEAASRDVAAPVRIEAVRALSKVRGKKAAATVIGSLRDPDDAVGNEAMRVLETWPAIQSMDLGDADDLMAVLRGADERAAARAGIVLAVQFREAEVPGIKAAGAAEQRDRLRQQIASSLEGIIESPGPAVSLLAEAIDAYGAVGMPKDARKLEKYLTADPDQRKLAQAACRALGSIGSRQSKVAIEETRTGETPPGCEPAKILAEHLRKPEEVEMFDWYALALVEIRDTAVEPLMKLFGESIQSAPGVEMKPQGDLRVLCAAALGRIGKPCVNMLFDRRGALAKQRRQLTAEQGKTSESPEVRVIDDRLRWYSLAMLVTRDTLASDFVDNVIPEQKPTPEMTARVRGEMAELARLKAEEWLAEMAAA